MKILELPNWLLSAVFAILYFVVFVVVECVARFNNYSLNGIQILSHSGTGAIAFFILCWFILSSWRKKEAIPFRTTPIDKVYRGIIDEETCKTLGGKVIDGDVCRITHVTDGRETNIFYKIKRK